ncbi:MAG TPA: glucose 1-dehydrogenase [Conexibacter sp.]|jgi:NAD(P)-dependent dehydrogenase (short-subunit alcohol dehydrogenase family)|nr:glucose 1-dehydrogenase [Conexibacter sp.]
MPAPVAAVTGASRGIGRAVALELAATGYDVGILYRADAAAAEDTAERVRALGRRAVTHAADLRDHDGIAPAVAALWDALGGLDALVNNAGAHRRTPFLEIEREEWDTVLALDLAAPAFLAQEVARRMVADGRPGSILNVGSINGCIAYQNLAHYCAAKGGLHMLTRAMALELAPHGIRVNAIAPGFVETDLSRPLLEDPERLRDKLVRIPLGRVGRPEEVARLAVHLLDARSAWVTGNVVLIDGGQHIH